MTLSRTYGICPRCGSGLFPLDEELALLPGHLAPRQQEHLTHLACFMPFEKATQMLETLLRVRATKETARYLTKRMGACMEAAHIAEGERPSNPPSTDQPTPQRCVLAMISLVNKQWAEVRTPAIGEPMVKRKIHVGYLSYVSRLYHVAGEIRRRKVLEARQVCSITDGAEWCQNLTSSYRPDALHTLDFPRRAEMHLLS